MEVHVVQFLFSSRVKCNNVTICIFLKMFLLDKPKFNPTVESCTSTVCLASGVELRDESFPQTECDV